MKCPECAHCRAEMEEYAKICQVCGISDIEHYKNGGKAWLAVHHSPFLPKLKLHPKMGFHGICGKCYTRNEKGQYVLSNPSNPSNT